MPSRAFGRPLRSLFDGSGGLMEGGAVVAGHLCLDIIPSFANPPDDPSALFSPGHLFEIESTIFSAGGAVANTGGALLALGIDTRLVARVGDDGFGAVVEGILRRSHPNGIFDLLTSRGSGTSYSLILSSPRFDRIFFHYSGANDEFASADVADDQLAGRDLLHFGYPPAMRRMYDGEGEELVALFARAKSAGLATSLDLSYPQPGSRAARADWRRILERLLPSVDFFLPGFEELQFMLSRGRETGGAPTAASLREDAGWVLGAGCPVCVVKLAADGLYVRTTDDERRIAAMGRRAPLRPELWADRELFEPCYAVETRGTTGAGDVTIAGFLAAFLKGLPLEQAARMALAAGASSVEGVDASTAVPGWQRLVERVESGWERRASRIVM